MIYGAGDVVKVKDACYIPPGTLCTVVKEKGQKILQVESNGLYFWVSVDSVELYRRHIDSPLRAEDDKRFWKLHPPTKRR